MKWNHVYKMNWLRKSQGGLLLLSNSLARANETGRKNKSEKLIILVPKVKNIKKKQIHLFFLTK